MKIEVNCMAKSRETALYYDPEGGERAQQVKTVLVCMGARIKNIAAADFAQTVGFALGRGSYAFLMRAMFDLPNGQILKNANGMSALRGGRGWLPIVVHGVGFLFGFSFFPYTLIVIALFGISLPQYLICYLLNGPIQKNIISPWERMQAQKET